ncbi:MAG: hypothetical protein GKS01_00780 [Alphaproteobacteria bacterium]|nr:hypothetical protein [Alphaproteobacteria bacterium]
MKITDIRLKQCVLRKEDPNWRFALGANPTTEGVIISIETQDGLTGYGYASATAHMGATRDGLTKTLEDLIPVLKKFDPLAMSAIRVAVNEAVSGNNQAKAAIDNALFDLVAKSMKVPLHSLFGGAIRTEFPVLRILAIKQPKEMAEQAQKLFDEGYRYFKIKVHGEIDLDIARVAAIREQVGDEANLTVDANQAYTPEDAITAITGMAKSRIDLVEQPVAIDDFDGLKRVTDSVRVTIEADESARSIEDVYELVSNRSVDAISLKVPKLGGLWNTLAAAQICKIGNVKYRFGAHVGSRLLNAPAMHLAATLPDIWYASEFGEFERLLDDPFEGIGVEDGVIRLPNAIGAGIEPVNL